MGKKKIYYDVCLESKSTYQSHQYLNVVEDHDNIVIYEIGNEITTDYLEAICIMMYDNRLKNDEIWNRKVNYDIEYDVEKSLFWLSGGISVWGSNFYNTKWSEISYLYIDKYKNIISNIVSKSKTFIDLKNNLINDLSYIELLDFSISIKNKI